MAALPDYLDPMNFVMRAVLPILIVAGSALAVARTPIARSRRRIAWLAVSAGTVGWFAVAYYLSKAEIFQARPGVLVPAIPFAIMLPIGIGLWALTRSAVIAEVIDATPLSWLVGAQVYRTFGFIFLVLWAGGHLPGEFALPAGIGDVAVGILAAAIALYASVNAKAAAGFAYGWNILGIADLVVAVATGFLTSPGMFQLLAHGRPNLLITSFPLVMVPAFAVPLSIILHGLCLWKLKRARERSAEF
jgi:hypothetical protein